MTRHAANNRCRDLWWRLGQPFTRQRRKHIKDDRCEVGYLGHHPDGMVHVMGTGPTWEAAFERAQQQKESTT